MIGPSVVGRVRHHSLALLRHQQHCG